jgi:hypothetical protein
MGKTPTNVLLHVVYPVKHVVYPVKIESSTVQTWRREHFRSEKELGKQQRYGTIVEEEVFENICVTGKQVAYLCEHEPIIVTLFDFYC